MKTGEATVQVKFTRSKVQKGMLRKEWHFEMNVVVSATEEERAALDRYGFARQPFNQLLEMEYDSADPVSNDLSDTTITDLLNGKSYDHTQIRTLLAVERGIMDALTNMQQLSDLADSFNGSQWVVDLSTGMPITIARD